MNSIFNATSPPALCIALLGSLRITYEGAAVAGFESDKSRALLCYLAMEGCPMRREHLAGLFWGDRSDQRARGNLSRVLSNLRTLFPDYIQSDRYTVGLNKALPLDLDVKAFDALCRQGLQVEGEEVCDLLVDAVDLYRDDFMTGFSLANCAVFEEWQTVHRERLHGFALRALDRLVQFFTRQGAWELALRYGRCALMLEPWSEETHRRVMLLLARTGQLNAALRQYNTCRLVLAEELHVEPSSETMALYERIAALGKCPRHNLPPQPTSFIGRGPVLTEIQRRLFDPDCRLLTLVGPGGSGKTRLALEAASLVQQVFLDGVFFVSLVGVATSEFMVPAIVDALGFSLVGQLVPKQQLLAHLKHKELLLVLDNMEHLLSDGALLISEILMEAPDVMILVTSRERLRLRWEWAFPITGLTCPQNGGEISETEAGQLFEMIACRADPSFSLVNEASAVTCLCRLVEGLPLGIELAAARAGTCSLTDLVEQVELNLAALVSPLRDMPARHRSLQAVFESSWQLLTPSERRTLAGLSVFRGEFDSRAAALVAEASPSLLRALHDRSLLVKVGDGRYMLHAQTRQFAALHLVEMGLSEDTLRDIHSCYYLDFLRCQEAALYGAQQQPVLEALEMELHNLHQAWNWAVGTRCMSSLIQAAPSLARFYDSLGRFQEGAAAFAQAVSNLDEDAEPFDEGVLLVYKGAFYRLLGLLKEAVACLESGLARLAPFGKTAVCAAGWVHLGLALHALTRFADAVHACEKGLACARAVGNPWGEAEALNALGNVYYTEGDYGTATAYYQQSAVHYETFGDQRGLARVYNNLGNITYQQADYLATDQWYQKSLAIKAALGDRWGMVISQHNLGELAYIAERYEEAHHVLTESLRLSREVGYRPATVASLLRLGDVAYLQAMYGEARRYYHEALLVARQMEDVSREAVALCGLGRVAMRLQTPEDARVYCEQAFALPTHPPDLLTILGFVAELRAVEGAWAKAVEIAAFVLEQPETSQETQIHLEAWLSNWGARLSSVVVEKAAQRGRERTFTDILTALWETPYPRS